MKTPEFRAQQLNVQISELVLLKRNFENGGFE